MEIPEYLSKKYLGIFMIFENRLNKALMSIFSTPKCSGPECVNSSDRGPQYREEDKAFVDKVKYHILHGNSMLKKPLRSGVITVDDIIYAIKNNRCLKAKERDIGSTNIETIVSTAIKDVFEASQVNQARKIFGLETKKD
jgi:hypothetical protein